MSNLIEAEGLIKSFGKVKALDGLDLGVGKGQIHGFLGPNGAGKSTTIRVLLGMYHTDGGRARVMGMDPTRAASHINRRLAYVPGSVSLWPSLTGGQVLDTLAGLRGSRDRARDAWMQVNDLRSQVGKNAGFFPRIRHALSLRSLRMRRKLRLSAAVARTMQEGGAK